MNKYISIITNFGCHYSCPYCIVKNNNLDIPKTTIEGLDNLLDCILSNDCNIVSISGGGDPLFNYDGNAQYYDRLFHILDAWNIPVEMHTTYLHSNFPYEKCLRVVYHLNLKNKDEIRALTKNGKEIIRVVFVVTDDMTKDDILSIVKMVKENPYVEELSFRQLVKKNYELSYHLYDFLKEGHKKDWYYITQGDYNLYYVENNIYTKFEDFKNSRI